ncbi:MAG: mechanosensitive ion channel domain-containing protein [Candidatus Nanoarchaeia archaeon]
MAYSLTTVNLVSAFLILVFGWVIGTTLGNITKKTFKSMNLTHRFEKEFNLKLDSVLASLVRNLLYTLTLLAALTRIGLTRTTLVWILIALLILTLIFTLLSFKNLLPNLFARYTLTRTQHIKTGSTIHIHGTTGTVLSVGFIETKIKTPNGEIISLPNALLKP